MVMVGGRIVVQEGRLADRRWEGLLERARAVGQQFLRASAG
jgi:hypothetical protein